jgi:hypothetical protein
MRRENLPNKAFGNELLLVVPCLNESFQSALSTVLGDEPRYAIRACRSRSIGAEELNDVEMWECTELVGAGIYDLGPKATKDSSLEHSSLKDHGFRRKQLHDVIVVVLVNKILYNKIPLLNEPDTPESFCLTGHRLPTIWPTL